MKKCVPQLAKVACEDWVAGRRTFDQARDWVVENAPETLLDKDLASKIITLYNGTKNIHRVCEYYEKEIELKLERLRGGGKS